MLKLLLKKIVKALQATLPPAAFNRVMGLGFPIYRKAVRGAFIAKNWLLYRFGDQGKWIEAQKIFAVMPYSLVGETGLQATYHHALRLVKQGVPGDFVELGVAQGGCSALIGSVIYDQANSPPNALRPDLWLFDSFEGLPEATKEDFGDAREVVTGKHVRPLPKGSCLGAKGEVKHLLLKRFNFPPENLHFIKGWFQDTLPPTSEQIESIALLRLDCDWYESTKICLEYFYDKVVDGGVVIIDDYDTCFGCKKAVDEFFDKRGVKADYDHDGRGGIAFVVAKS